MPDPRLKTNRLGIDPEVHTYQIDGSGDIVYDGTQPNGSAVTGRAVMLSGNNVIRLTADGVRVLGKLLQVDFDGFCSVLVEGVCALPSSGTITAGTAIVGALSGGARGYIRSVVAATLADVANGDGVVIDATDAANVEVDLD